MQILFLKNLELNKNNSKTNKFLDPHSSVRFSDDFTEMKTIEMNFLKLLGSFVGLLKHNMHIVPA